MCVIWNLGTKIYPKFITLRSFFKIFPKSFKNVKKIQKIEMDSKKLIKVIWNEKNDRSPDYLCDNYFFWQFVNNFSALLSCNILTSLILLIISDFNYNTNHWNSDRIKLLAGSRYVKHHIHVLFQKIGKRLTNQIQIVSHKAVCILYFRATFLACCLKWFFSFKADIYLSRNLSRHLSRHLYRCHFRHFYISF